MVAVKYKIKTNYYNQNTVNIIILRFLLRIYVNLAKNTIQSKVGFYIAKVYRLLTIIY
jgi:hypothetical protein